MSRTYVVTGSSSGIGAATVDYLRRQGHRVLGVARHDAEIIADLSSDEGRRLLRPAVTQEFGPVVDGVIACAGGGPPPDRPPSESVRINYFGAVATLTELRPLLANSPAPRALLVTSVAVLMRPHQPVVDACLAGDELGAIRAGVDCPFPSKIYGSAKRAAARWVRQQAMTEAWAGAGIVLNAAAPGLVRTRMTEEVIDGEGGEHDAILAYSTTLLGDVWQPEQIAPGLAWLVSAENPMTTGQCLFMDGGVESLRRGDDIW